MQTIRWLASRKNAIQAARPVSNRTVSAVSANTTVQIGKPPQNLPDKFVNVNLHNTARTVCRPIQGKESVRRPIKASDLYVELQHSGSGTCGLHAMHHYIGTHCLTSKDISSQVDINSFAKPAFDEIAKILAKIGDNDLSNVFASPHSNWNHTQQSDRETNVKKAKQIVAEIGELAIHDPLTESDVVHCRKLVGDLRNLLAHGGNKTVSCTKKVDECLNIANEIYGVINVKSNGTAPDVIAKVLAVNFDKGTVLGNANDFSADGQSGKLNYSVIFEKLNKLGVDRAIIGASGHFLALRATGDGWCVIDSLSGRVHREIDKFLPRTGQSFSGVIYPSIGSDAIAEEIFSKLAKM
ncbi:MAG: hypothetical protein LBR91_02060 [Puniceicoccales bacterium]|nr:hypothetical protein [Puniceicoccales bacterium]